MEDIFSDPNDLNSSIQNLLSRIRNRKENVLDKMEKRYIKFVPVDTESGEILKMCEHLTKDVETVLGRFDSQTKQDVKELTGELTSLRDSLIESSVIVDVMTKLSKLEKGINEADQLISQDRHYKGAKCLHDISSYLTQDCNDLNFLNIYDSLTVKFAFIKTNHCRDLIKKWKKDISWSIIDNDLKNEKIPSTLTVTEDLHGLEDLLKTMELYEISFKEIATFSDIFLKVFLKPVIKKTCIVSHKISPSGYELSITCIDATQTPSYMDVIKNLKLIFDFFEKYLNVRLHESSFIACVGEYVAEDFLQFLIDECLTNAVPVPMMKENRQIYSEFVEPIINFQTLLKDLGFLSPPHDKTLESYFGEPDTLFLNKTTEMYCKSARTLIKKDLLDIMVVPTKVAVPAVAIKKEEPSSPSERQLSDLNKMCPNLFEFPECSISKSTEEFIILIDDIFKAALGADAKVSVQLFSQARDLVSLYPQMTRIQHAKVLQDLPLASGLLYNNLMYLAHKILIMDYDKKVTSDKYPAISCLPDLAIPLWKEAEGVLDQLMLKQRKCLLSLIKESGLSALSEYEVLPTCTEKCIKASIKQLNHLKGVLESVLPSTAYGELLGSLCGALIEEVVSRVVSTSDIRADIATSLASLLTLLQTSLPLLFSCPSEVYRRVKSWSKLKELILVLSGSLAEVGERWADGKGPLALEFTPDQVRQMIKALYQVSDRRAAVLSRIKS